jgi:hypothetical protein
MMAALTLGALVTRVHASVTHEPRSIAWVILYSHSPQPAEGHGTRVSTGASPVRRGGVRSYATRGNTGAHH